MVPTPTQKTRYGAVIDYKRSTFTESYPGSDCGLLAGGRAEREGRPAGPLLRAANALVPAERARERDRRRPSECENSFFAVCYSHTKQSVSCTQFIIDLDINTKIQNFLVKTLNFAGFSRIL